MELKDITKEELMVLLIALGLMNVIMAGNPIEIVQQIKDAKVCFVNGKLKQSDYQSIANRVAQTTKQEDVMKWWDGDKQNA